jgi:Ca2+-binding EF-hand superfamily protein
LEIWDKLKQLGQNLGEHLEEEEIEGLLDEADEGEGFILYSDFCDINNLTK